jgi:hypothetical protein
MTYFIIIAICAFCSHLLSFISEELFIVRDQGLSSGHRAFRLILIFMMTSSMLVLLHATELLELNQLVVAILFAVNAVVATQNIAGHVMLLVTKGVSRNSVTLFMLIPAFGLLAGDLLLGDGEKLSSASALLAAGGALLAGYLVRRRCAE